MSAEQEEQVEELAGIIYSQCGIKIRNDESYAIAEKLIELGWEKKTEEEK